METSPGGTLVVKKTQGELQALVELLAKKRRSVKLRDMICSFKLVDKRELI